MNPNIDLTFADGVHIVVPDSLNFLTTYVLREQGDWFEDEIKFLRRLLKPGQRAIDIGASFGAYTLTMAKAVGPGGRVWAFEPISSTAATLASSIEINNFGHVVLEQKAVSNTTGTAQMSLNENSEFNELIRNKNFSGEREAVSLLTLDDSMEIHKWKDIDFMKIDAEGEEINILRGGKHFLSTESPLIQYEIRAGTSLHLDLVREFAFIGYKSYRLVPGLNLLVPFDAEEGVDNYLLNLFCCKPDKAEKLAEQGVLVEAKEDRDNSRNTAIDRLLDDLLITDSFGWRERLAKLPYGKLLYKYWEKTVADGKSGEVEKSLALYAISQEKSLPPNVRYAALEASFIRFKDICEINPAHLRLASLARVARDFGARSVTVSALMKLWDIISIQRQLSPIEPFLVPGERFESISPQAENYVGNWVAATVLEELEKNHYFSSYDSGVSNLKRLTMIHELGFGSDEMERRFMLVKQRFGAQVCA